MSKSNLKLTQNLKIALDHSYKSLLEGIKSKLKSSQLRAAIAINHQLLEMYWEIGSLIIQQHELSKWGDKLFDNLSNDLYNSFPGSKGFSKTNLKNMKAFATHYPHKEFGQALPDQLTWTHHILLLQMFNQEQLSIKRWYAEQTVINSWSYRQLREQIQQNLFERQGKLVTKTTNFVDKLPAIQSSLANDMLKDPYKFHFLLLGEDAHEREVHSGLEKHIRQFLMELGQGFAFYGSYYPVYVSNKRFEIDLLMYNTKLHCYFVIEIKRGEFKPEHTGQLNFYLSAIDESLKMAEDGPTMGLLLCEQKDKIIAEYALRRVDSPMGISEYEVSKSLPKRLRNVFPTTDEIESELSEISKHQKNDNSE